MSTAHVAHRSPLATVALLCAMSLPLTACTQPMTETTKPDYRENPNPQQAYRLTMTVRDAPGPLKISVSAAQYDVVNTECLPPPKDNPGGRSSPVPTSDLPFELAQTAEGVYTGTIYADAMLDEDYHGRGVCEWALVQAQVQLRASDAEGESRFIASLSRHAGDFESGRPKTTYFWKGGYPRAGTPDFPDLGEPAVDRFKPEMHDELFSITLVAEEATP